MTMRNPGCDDIMARRLLEPRSLRAAGACLVLVMLAGCAGARVSDIAANHVQEPAPVAILVEVDSAAIAGSDRAAAGVANPLQSDLIAQLLTAKVKAAPFGAGAIPAGNAVLHVSITEAEPGSFWKRLVIGFGLGRAELRAKVDLEAADAAGPRAMTSFATSSDNGRVMPGLILPAAVAVATRNIIPLAVGGGIKLVTSRRGGLDQPTEDTARAIVTQLKAYYVSVGWHWPAGDKA